VTARFADTYYLALLSESAAIAAKGKALLAKVGGGKV